MKKVKNFFENDQNLFDKINLYCYNRLILIEKS